MGHGGGPGRRLHLEEEKFIKELEKMYAQGKVEGNGKVTVSFSRIPEKFSSQTATAKATTGKKKKGEQEQVSGAVTKGQHAIVRGKRKGKTISCIMGTENILKFQANLAFLLRGTIDNLKRPEKKPKAKKAAPAEPKKAA